jgi:uncharacterized protein (DUF433 family)
MDRELLNRIAVDPRVMGGKPVLRGTRLRVDFVLRLLANGATPDDILKEYHGLVVEDIRACLSYAAKNLGDDGPSAVGTITE